MGFGNWIGDHSEGILLAVGLGTSVMAGVLFAKAGAKSARELDDARESMIDESQKDISAKEKTKIVAKNFWIPCVLEGISIFAILGSNKIKDVKTSNAIAASVASANLATQALNDYRQQVRDQLGDNTDRKLRDGVASKRMDRAVEANDGHLPTPVNPKCEGDVYCVDSLTGQAFWSTPEKLHKAENLFVKEINDEFSCTWEEWNNKLPIRAINEGVAAELEWTTDDHFALFFTSELINERPVLYIQYDSFPHGCRRMGEGY